MKWTLLLACVGLLAVGCGDKDEPATAEVEKKPSKPSMMGQGTVNSEPLFDDEKAATQPAKK